MKPLRRFTLSYNSKRRTWNLKIDKTQKVLHVFIKKRDATKKGILKQLLGKEGGSVKIKSMKGEYHEERTYPRQRDPRSSKG